MLCGLNLGILIWGGVLVLHQKAVEIGNFLTLIRKTLNNFYFIGGRQYFNEGLHVILLLAFSDEKMIFLMKSKQAQTSRIFSVRKRARFPLYFIPY